MRLNPENMHKILKCGCSAQAWLCKAYQQDEKPGCGIHSCDELMEVQPDLNIREMQCAYCKQTKPSDNNEAFFEFRPNKEFDMFYCGCRGWD